MSRYLVAGAAGFIGARVCSLLIEQGHQVVGVDNLNDAYYKSLKHYRLGLLRELEQFEFHQLDICRRDEIAQLFGRDVGLDAVVNLAARAGVRPSVEDPWIYFDANLTGTLNLLDACVRWGVEKFVLASTSSLYGESEVQPLHEELPTDRPISPYAASKKAAEVLCYTYHDLHGLDVTAFRYFTVYGPAGRPDMAPFRFVQWITERRPVIVFGDGHQSRDFTYVDDIAQGTILGLQEVGYGIINLGSDFPVSVLDLIRLIERLTQEKAQLEFRARYRADVMRTWADVEKARELLGWQSQWSFAKGVQSMVDWYQANREWARKIKTGE